MNCNIQILIKKAASWIKQSDKTTKFRVISHYDADGITAAAIISKAIYREGFDFHATLMRNPFTKGIESIINEENSHLIFTDMGSGQLSMIEDIDSDILIIDHHQLKNEKTKNNIIQLNANQCGIDGNYEACGATLSYAIAKTLNKRNRDLAGLAIAGATGDKQYIGGFNGFNKTIVNEALKYDYLSENIGLKLSQLSISESIFYSVEPFYRELSGNRDNINELLDKLDIGRDESYRDISDDKKKKLHSYLIFHLLKQGCESNILDTVIRNRYSTDQTFGELEQFADLLDACGKGGYRDIGLALCLGDSKLYQKAKSYEKAFKNDLLETLVHIDIDGVKETDSYRYFYTDQTSLGGVIAGIATNFILDKQKPLFSIAKKSEDIHISCRGNQYLVNLGLDLGGAMSNLAGQLNGQGGGHRIAAGATIPIEFENQFLKETENILLKQLHHK